MPTYQYACTACGHQLEAVQSFSDDPLTQCPACQGRLRKLFSAVGIVFKGSGFYRNDARNDARRGGSKPRGGDSKELAGVGSPASKSTADTASTSTGSTSTGSSANGSSANGSSGSGTAKGSTSGGTSTTATAAK